jgi:DNA-binding PadR family transcriptional regulator
MTLQTQLVLRAFLSDPQKPRYGLELCDMVGLPSGTIYPILARLEQVGWLESGWEEAAVAVTDARPRRRFYWLTREGAEQVGDALARTYRSHRQPRAGWGAQPGMGGVTS